MTDGYLGILKYSLKLIKKWWGDSQSEGALYEVLNDLCRYTSRGKQGADEDVSIENNRHSPLELPERTASWASRAISIASSSPNVLDFFRSAFTSACNAC